MEKRSAKLQLWNPGGTASKNALSCRVTIPTSWIKDMGFTKEDRIATLLYDEEKKCVLLKKESDESEQEAKD